MATNALNQMIANSIPTQQSGLNQQLSSLLSNYGYVPSENPATFGLRPDQTPKAQGYFGQLPNAQGGVSTELSTTVNFDGKDVLIPLLVPTLDQSEVQHLLNGGDPTQPMVQKAAQFAIGRLSQGLSPFASNQEIPYGIKLPQ